MGRKAKGRRPKTSNNKWGPQDGGIDNQNHTHGFKPPTRGPRPSHRRGPQAYRRASYGPHITANQYNPFDLNNNNRGRGGGGRGGGRSGQGGRGSHDNNSNIAGDLNDNDNFTPEGPTFSPKASRHDNHNNRGNRGRGSPNQRFCVECSSVRRVNLRFRDWAAQALRQCGKRFVAWAEEAGVEFGAVDEMDWQPEPVTQVLFLRSPPEQMPPPPMNKGAEKVIQQFQQYLELQQQQQRYQQPQHQYTNPSIGPLPYPGPWAWPPYSDGSMSTTATSSTLPSPTGHQNGTLYNNPQPQYAPLNPDPKTLDSVIPMPISSFGILGGMTTGPGMNQQWQQQQPCVTSHAPLQPPVMTSACSGGLGLGSEIGSFGGAGVPVSLGKRRNSGSVEEGRLSPYERVANR
ncbi:uncharacterized protein F4822DRAFT_182379 [Hypoxylon trugodes]|uniref:uncharacterized protein n=1 Tax=Hypoxylon trugodes TaxID=326681 RepID=UPI002195281E|nr:uncharacterized protein F4822DRAFT_182379 [Hypoxylon trugodes]KAI1391335.1 hypothetical protein F4822DRAFT_182379 [Hypoxylon trugodes]